MNGVSLHTEVISEEIEKLAPAVHLPVISEPTDAGPGVGVSNLEVETRFVELSKTQCTDRRVRIHRAHGDSCQNEAEGTNASIGDALVDGGSIKWEYFTPYDGLSEEKINDMTVEDLESYAEYNMERNA